MAKLIGTAGHVDHGKTSLIRALTGIDADRLPEEKRRGMTIDLGFAYLDLPGHGRVSIVDVPGHERFLTNMLAGAQGIDVALLCVAADAAVMPQTREHFAVLCLLPVDSMVVALTRSDVADTETQEIAQEEVRELLRGTRFADAPVIRVSSETGEGLSDLRTALARALDGVRRGLDQPWYLPVDRVFSVRGHGVVVTGTLMQGRVRPGDSVQIEPGGAQARVRQIQSHDEPLGEGEAGQRVALNLSGVKAEHLIRGMVAASLGTVFATTLLEARVNWLDRPRQGSRVRIAIGAEEGIGRVRLADEGEGAQFRIERPLAAVVGQPLIVRAYSPATLLGGGLVTVPVAHRWRAGQSARMGLDGDVRRRVLEAVGSSEGGLNTQELCRVVGQSPQALGQTLESLSQEGKVLGLGGLWFSPGTFEDASRRYLRALDELHGAQPSKLAHPREAAAKKAGLAWEGKALDRIVARLAQAGQVRTVGSGVALAGRQAVLPPAQRQLLDRVKRVLVESKANVPQPGEIASMLGVPPQAVEGILKVGMDAGEVLRLDEGIYYTGEQFEALGGEARRSLPEWFTASQFREALQTSRKYAIPLLERMDARGVTHRQGDLRRFV